MSSDDASRPFASAAEHYARYRPGYSDRTIGCLRDRFALTGSERALDLGCGTGEVAVPLSEHVGAVVAMDPEPAMLAAARRAAASAGRANIEWLRGSDATLSALSRPFRLATMGRSFHRMNQERTLAALYRLLDPGGGVALLWSEEWLTRGTEAWQDVVYDTASEFLDDLPERTGPVEHDDPWDELLAEFGFADVETRTFHVRREWTVEGIVGYVLSLSFCSPATFGDDRDAFEDAVRARLRGAGRGPFVQADTETVISGRRPADG